MMYLKQFPDICREMGFDVEEKAKTVTLRVTDINVNYSINKKLFLEDLELTIDSYSEVCVAIAIFEAETKAGKYDNLDATELQKLKCVFDKAWETGRLKDDTGMFQTEVDSCHQQAECLKAVLEKLLEKLKKEVDKARLYSTSSHDFPIVMKQIDYAIDMIDKFYIEGKHPAFSASVGRDAVIIERMARHYVDRMTKFLLTV